MLQETHMKNSGFACLGEVLLRFSAPSNELLLQSGSLNVHIGGAEANVAVSLAQFGHRTTMVSVVPEGPLGKACIGELRRHGVRTEAIQTGPGRMGLYFLTVGAGHRPSEVLYDRADSAFAIASPGLMDWPEILSAASWLHVSGVTPALGPGAAEAALRAVRAARQLGRSVSFDCNYRAKLWERWHGDARTILRELVAESDLLFAEERDMALILGADFNEGLAHSSSELAHRSSGLARGSSGVPHERFELAATAALAQFPHLKWIATTVRTQKSVDHHDLAAKLMTRDGSWTTRTYSIGRIVDRIGSGDAFAAGVLHGLETGLDSQSTLDFGLAAACLKHSIPGDFNLIGVADVHNLLRDAGFTVRR
jgi:2-dehydro-3-deoxygluconokinase